MIHLCNALRVFGTPEFETVLKYELAQNAAKLPLQQGLSASSSVSDAPITVVIHGVAELENVVRIKAGIFYKGLLGGCSCADDPTSSSENNEYCEVQLDMDKITAATAIRLITE